MYTSRDALDAAAQGVVPKNTLPVNEWAKKNLLGPFILTKGFFLDRWMQFRLTMEDPSEAFPCDLLIDINHLSLFSYFKAFLSKATECIIIDNTLWHFPGIKCRVCYHQ